jgi:hypothetical protein
VSYDMYLTLKIKIKKIIEKGYIKLPEVQMTGL